MVDEPVAPNLGLAIKLRRTRLKMSRQALVHSSGLSYPYLAEIESGRKVPSMKALDQIARALDIPASDLQREGEGLSEPDEVLFENVDRMSAPITTRPTHVEGDDLLIREISDRVRRELAPLIERQVEAMVRAELRSRGVIR